MKLYVITLLPLRSIGMKLCQLIFLSISTVPDGTVHSLIFLLFLQIFQIIIHALPEIEIISSHSLLQLQFLKLCLTSVSFFFKISQLFFT